MSEIHKKKAGRKVHGKDVFADASERGGAAIIRGKVITKWHKRREREVSENEDWAEIIDDFLFDGDD
jgi:hypothetical protein